MIANTSLDELDIALLKELQNECRTPLQEIAEKVGAPASTVHYRLKRLERTGVIDGYFAKLNPEELGLEYTASIRIGINLETGTYEKIGRELTKIPGVWIVYLILGDCDFLLITRSKDRNEFLEIVDKILEIKGIKQLHTQVVAKRLKEDSRLELVFP